jgi:hypothetical protein
MWVGAWRTLQRDDNRTVKVGGKRFAIIVGGFCGMYSAGSISEWASGLI